MVRVGAVALVFLFFVLPGCTGSSAPEDDGAGPGTDFDDLDLDATETTGVIRGVVVDDRIVPVEGAKVELRLDTGSEVKESDAEGRFGFDALDPGTYFLSVSKLNYDSVQSTVEVVAGVDDPPVQRLLITRLFDVEPYSSLFKFEGFLQCSNGIGVGTTCVNDYTRLLPPCNGGCLQDYNVSQAAGNNREYVTNMTGGWQTMVWEMVWEPTSTATSAEMALLVSYFARPDTTHYFGNARGETPLKLRMELNESAPGQN